MKDSAKNNKSGNIRKMFKSISGRYDLLNTLITFGRDKSWRKYVVKEACLKQGSLILDAGTGTGNILQEALLVYNGIRAFGADFTIEMMLAGKEREERISWCCADALNLPFAGSVFDAVTSGYLIRNVTDISRAFIEQVRTVKPGGRIVCLETSPPPQNLLRPFILLYLKFIIPMLGLIFAGNRNAYRYLTSSTESFKTPEQLSILMRDAGLSDIRIKLFMFGTIAVLSGTRP
ncbi:MAG: ubiquinone/menaquinone biosynthesis methyltransferase [Desulfobacteraceae bacterium]|nr:MAG: ubiquinone/menaquinone biosynthesis methyltransferase [Desulfobacteraceae bacterium]